jgi:hypothetical protein
MSLAFGLPDSPAGLAAWIVEKLVRALSNRETTSTHASTPSRLAGTP